MNTDFLGKGFAFPLSINPRGGINQSQQEQKIKDSIRMILGTQYDERVMRPNFGCNLKSLIFAPNNKATANLAKYYVEEGLNTWEPRIILEDVIVKNDYENNCLTIQVFYKIKATYEPQSLVYPFYLEAR
ncbi:MAG: GPW/gp25 family protein [Nostocaceae cyanobacterium]|nr:GPW/gp25 family protein [Nostocaceae cyanobacterium]